MKIKNASCYVFLILITFAIICGCATTRNHISEEEFFNVWSGTWVNTDTPGTPWVPQKIVNHPDGTYGFHIFETNLLSYCDHTFILLDQWIESDGNIWFTAKTTCPVTPDIFFQYGRIKDSGNTLEFIHRGSTPIEKWEPNGEYYNYCIYYRE